MKFKHLLILPLLVASLQAATVSDLTFTLNGGSTEYSVSDCLETASGSIDIPNTYNGLPVTSIGIGAFLNCTSLTGISIPNGVSSIGNGAFYNCNSITSINIPTSVSSIETGVFADCSSLISIIIPDNVNSIQEYAFQSCTSLTRIIFEGNAPTFETDVFLYSDSVTIYYDSNYSGWSSTVAGRPAVQTNTLTYAINDDGTEYSVTDCSESASDSLVIPSTYNGLPVTSIGGFAFRDCSSLTDVTIPDSMTSIGIGAFQDCTSLTGISIPNGVSSIGNYAFYNCISLTSINIPTSVTSIETGVFVDCSALISIIIPDNVNSIQDYAFGRCTSLTRITFEGDAPTFGTDVFSYSDSVTIYYDSNYSGWSSTVAGRPAVQTNTLTYAINDDGTEYSLVKCSGSPSGSLVIPSTYNGLPVTSIENTAFDHESSLSSITIPYGVTSIGAGAFMLCTGLTSITIPDSVTSIGDIAFTSCSSLVSITIPNGVTSIGTGLFAGCSSLTSFTIPNNVTSIGNNAFTSCSSLSSITIPDMVTSIGEYAFDGCTSLTSIAITDSVTSIGEYAFRDVPASITFSKPLLEAVEAERDAALAQRDARPTLVAYETVIAERDTAIAQRDARLTESEVRDLRLGSSMLEVVDGDASINIELEATENLGITSPTWTPVPESKVVIHPNFLDGKIKIDVEADDEYSSGVRFFRFKMSE